MERASGSDHLSRRRFLSGSVAVLGPLVIVREALGAPARGGSGQGMGVCGLGRGMGMIGGALAVSDVDRGRMDTAVKRLTDAKGYVDFREMLDRKDIEFVRVVTPPHWHALISIMAMRAGKHVFCEKPLTRTIGEGRAFVEAVKRYKVGFTYGAHTETPNHDVLRKVTVSGILGAPLKIYFRGSKGCNFKVGGWTGMVNQKPQPVPPTLDWDLYCGPSPLKPYHPHRTHGSFRGYWDYDGGGLTDMAPHVFNELLGNIGKDDTSPSEIETVGPPAHDDAVGVFNYSRLTWADGTALLVDSGVGEPKDGADPEIFIEGPNGKVKYGGGGGGGKRGGSALVSEPLQIMEDLKGQALPPSPSKLAGLPSSVAKIIHAHRTNSLAILINTSLRVGRKIRFDPVQEVVIGDPQANALIHPPMRAPWSV
jgi:myo-inositol 2-dehydrogenase/D-chiro-inositol 1-dehydrogenase